MITSRFGTTIGPEVQAHAAKTVTHMNFAPVLAADNTPVRDSEFIARYIDTFDSIPLDNKLRHYVRPYVELIRSNQMTKADAVKDILSKVTFSK